MSHVFRAGNDKTGISCWNGLALLGRADRRPGTGKRKRVTFLPSGSHIFRTRNDKPCMRRWTLLVGLAFSVSWGVWAQDAAPAPQEAADATPKNPQITNLDSLSMEELMQLKVESAAFHSQSLRDAPASVTVITGADIDKYGYRTLGEALASVRGFYLSNDRISESVGVRGFNLPGDDGSHILVMVNGHNMADNIFDFNHFGPDFPIDMSLVKQIEIIRGPASALYGSNAIFATINVVTKSPDEAGPLALIADAGSYGEKKGQVSGTASFAGVQVLVSGSVYNDTGQSPIFIPQLDTPATNYGNVIDMNGVRGYHLFSDLVWGNWNITASFAGHTQIDPIFSSGIAFNDRGTEDVDRRDYVEAAYRREIAGGTLRWRIYYDSFHYLGRYDYQLSSGGVDDNREITAGDWVGSQLTYRFRASAVGDFTVGAESSFDIRNRVSDFNVSPVAAQLFDQSHPDRAIAVIAQDEKQLSEHWKLDLGLRLDLSRYRHDFLSPRAGLIYQRSEWSYKFLYGRSFRNPATIQLFGAQGLAPNLSARPESADTFEIDAERRMGKRINLQASTYGYRLRNFLVGALLPGEVLQYQNTGRIQAEGVEVEINGRPAGWLEATVSYALQRSRDDGAALVNSPEHLAKLHFSVPLGRKFDFSTGVEYQSSRLTLAGSPVSPACLTDFTLASKHLLPDLDIRFGLRNAFNTRYSDPIELYPITPSMPQPGRTFFVELIARRAR